MTPRVLHVAGLERLTTDILVDRVEAFDAGIIPDQAVEFLDPTSFDAVAARAKSLPHSVALGGSIGCALQALLGWNYEDMPRLRLEWCGIAGTSPSASWAAAQYRSLGVHWHPLAYGTDHVRTVCIVDRESHDNRVLVGPHGGYRWTGEHIAADIVLLGLDLVAQEPELLAKVLSSNASVGLSINHEMDQPLGEEARCLLRERVIAASGGTQQIAALERELGSEHGGLTHVLGCPILETRGAAGSVLHTMGMRREFPPARLAGRERTLGAGDSLFAGFVTALACGQSPDLATQQGNRICQRWITGASVNTKRLADALGAWGAPSSVGAVQTAAALRLEFHESPPFLVVTGGQTGVDTLALECSTSLGLPSIAIFPSGLRREAPLEVTDKPWISVRRVELSTPSYGDRTAAFCAVADAILLAAPVDSEGSVATRAMAHELGTPLFELVYGREIELASTLADLNPTVVGIAGNRESILDDRQTSTIRQSLERLLRALATRELEDGDEARRAPAVSATIPPLARRLAGDPSSSSGVAPTRPLRIAVPSSRTAGEIALRLAHAWCQGLVNTLKWLDTPVGSARCPRCGYEFVRCRTRDIPFLASENAIDAALGGYDEIYEGGGLPAGWLFRPTAFLSSAIVEAGSPTQLKHAVRIVTQLPRIAGDSDVWGRTIEPILGQAEGIVRLLSDAIVVDTVHTGVHLAANGLSRGRTVGITQLVMATGPSTVVRWHELRAAFVTAES